MKNPSSNQAQQRKAAAGTRQVPDTISGSVFAVLTVALAAVVFGVYRPALDFQFILDDHRFTSDPRLQSAGYVWDYFANYVWAQTPGGPASFYRPVFVLWLRLNFILGELSPWGWHLLSIAKHVVVAALLGWLTWRLLRDRVAALLAASLFALHPAQTESVAWATVPDPVMATGVLAALLFYVRYTWGTQEEPAKTRAERRQAEKNTRQGAQKQKNPMPRWLWLALSAVATFAALLAKETAIVLPAIIFALAMLQPRGSVTVVGNQSRGLSFGARLQHALLQCLPFLGAVAIYLLLRFHALGGKLTATTQGLPWSTVVMSWPAILWFYLKVILWPVQSRAFADPTIVEAFSVRNVLLPGLGVLCGVTLLSVGVVWAWKKVQHDSTERNVEGVHWALLMGGLLLVLPLLPVLNLNVLNPGDFLHGRYMYLPSAGFMLLVASGWHLAGAKRHILLYAACLVAVVFCVLTRQQEMQWKDDLTVFTIGRNLAPHNEPLALNLANAHVQAALKLGEGRCSETVPVFEKVTRDYPKVWYAWAALGECFVQLHDLPQAEASLRNAAELSKEPRVIEEWQELRAAMGLANQAGPR